jgi:hypothetical protein
MDRKCRVVVSGLAIIRMPLNLGANSGACAAGILNNPVSSVAKNCPVTAEIVKPTTGAV